MDSTKLILTGVVGVIAVLGIAIGALFLTFEPSTTNGSGNNNPGIETDTDLLELELQPPNWELIISDGSLLSLHSLREKFVVVDLMQTGDCIPCQIQTAHLKDLYDGYEGRLEIISLSLVLSDTVERVASFKSQNDILWYVGIDTNGVFGSYFNVQSVPTLIVIDDQGYVRWVHVGVWSFDDISETLSQLNR